MQLKDTAVGQTIKRILWRSWNLTRIYNKIINQNPLREPQGRIWIGGFPRSGNTFAATFIEYMTICDHVEKHLHSPAQVLRFLQSSDRGLVVFREPLSACLSLSIFSGIEVARALQNYIDFHTILLDSGQKIQWVDFNNFNQNPLLLIKLLDLKTQCKEDKLKEFKCEPHATIKAINQKIDEGWNKNADQIFIRQTARPMAEREKIKQELEKHVLESACQVKRLNAANKIFKKIKSSELTEMHRQHAN